MTDPLADMDAFGALGGDAGSTMGERVLNQDEIDSLLGFDLGGDDGAGRSGIRAIINSTLVSYERLPMLEIVFDRGLPDSFDETIYNEKCEAAFHHLMTSYYGGGQSVYSVGT